jgi:hypothetical protein
MQHAISKEVVARCENSNKQQLNNVRSNIGVTLFVSATGGSSFWL